MKKILTFIYSILMVSLAFGQTNWSGQDNTYFLYAEGSSARFPNEKVLLVSSHIISFDNVKNIRSHLGETLLSLAFSEAVDKIYMNESVAAMASYYNIHFGSPRVESYVGTGGIHYSDGLDYNVSSADSKLSAMEKKRTGIISDYIDKGYKVYQIYFNPLNYSVMQSGNAVDDAGATLVFQPRSKLSELWIARYIPGEIKRRMTYLRDQEDEKRKESLSISDSEARTITTMNRMRAAELEREGDQLYAMGTLYYPQAIEKYQMAHQLHPTASTESKLRDHEALLMTAEGLSKLGGAVDKGVDNLDPEKKTQFAYSFLAYNGLMGNFSKLDDPKLQKPKSILLGFSGHRIFLSWEMRMGYSESPIFNYAISGKSQGNSYKVPTEDTLSAYTKGYTLGMSAGLNIPVKGFLVYGMFGYDMMGDFLGVTKVVSEGYEWKEGSKKLDLIMFPQNWILGVNYNIPKSKLSVGLTYNIYSLKGKSTQSENILAKNNSADEKSTFYTDNSSLERYKYSYFGVRLLIRQ